MDWDGDLLPRVWGPKAGGEGSAMDSAGDVQRGVLLEHRNWKLQLYACVSKLQPGEAMAGAWKGGSLFYRNAATVTRPSPDCFVACRCGSHEDEVRGGLAVAGVALLLFESAVDPTQSVSIMSSFNSTSCLTGGLMIHVFKFEYRGCTDKRTIFFPASYKKPVKGTQRFIFCHLQYYISQLLYLK